MQANVQDSDGRQVVNEVKKKMYVEKSQSNEKAAMVAK